MFDFFNFFLVCLVVITNPNDNPCYECIRIKDKPSVFLETLVGKWQGYAVQTPIGKVDYNLNFKTLKKNKIKGTSHTNGRAIHTWIFESRAEGQLLVDFHSTFGDSWAKGLCVTQVVETKGYLFSNGNPSQLKVWVNPVAKDEIQIEIFLRDEPHVRIVISRVKS